MVPLPSDTLTLPLLPRVIPRITQHIQAGSQNKNAKHRPNKGIRLSTTHIIIIAVVAAVAFLVFVAAVFVCVKVSRRRQRARAPKDVMSSSSSGGSGSSVNIYDNAATHGHHDDHFNTGFPPPGQDVTAVAPRPLGDSLSPEMHDVPLTAGLPVNPGPRYGYGQQVDGLRVPGMAAKPVAYGYNQQAPASHFSST